MTSRDLGQAVGGVLDGEGVTYAIGDIHGRLDLLERATDAIMEDLAGRPGRVICLGDYVDRGPDSRGVVEFLMEAQRNGSLICLKGNHEDMMVRAYRERTSNAVYHWQDNGGVATLASYGATLMEEVPEAHIEWMERLPFILTDEQRIYVHAGIMPGFSTAEEQSEETCLWIRTRFLHSHDLGPLHVVHGHTPIWDGKPDPGQPELLPHRTNLDTGAFHTGVLTVGVFEGDGAAPTRTLRITNADTTDRLQEPREAKNPTFSTPLGPAEEVKP